MPEIIPEKLSHRLQTNVADLLVLDIRHVEEYDDWYISDHSPNFERVRRTDVRQESIPEDELAELKLGSNNDAAE